MDSFRNLLNHKLMIHYILDGNNILKSTSEFLKLSNRNFIMAQEKLVAWTAKVLCCKSEGIFATIFFDGTGLNYKFNPPKNTRVIFGKEESADTLIIKEIKRAHNLRMQGKDLREIIVISDDREIREAAKIFGTKIWRTNEFVARLFPKHKKKSPHSPRIIGGHPSLSGGHPSLSGGYPIEKIISPAHQEKITEELKKYYKGN